jgi:uncharacterized membrane protein
VSDNPYSQPESNVQTAVSADLEIHDAKSRPIGHGWRWYGMAWDLFKPSWGIWLLTLLVFLAVMIVLQIVPFIGPIAANLIAPVMLAGFINLAHRAQTGQSVEVGELFAGFRHRTGALIGLGALNLVVTIVVVGAMMAPMFSAMGDMSAMQGMSDEQMAQEMMSGGGTGSMLLMLVALALLIPWLAAYWFATPLIFLADRGLGAALKESFFACFKNILPFLWFGILYFVLAAVASIPLFLGWFVLLPVLMISLYTAFRDIFVEE